MAIGRRTQRQAVAALVAVSLWLAAAFDAAAQEPAAPRERKNAFYAEHGGGGFMTVNYERDLLRHVSLRVGVGAIPMVGGPDVVVTPSFSLGSQRHRFSAGLGVVAVRYESGEWEAAPSAELTYRLQNPSGFVFRATLATLPQGQGGLIVLPGVGVGWSF